MKRSSFQIPRNIQLADPNFNVSSKIDILLGAEIFWSLLCIGQIRASNEHPTLQKTKLGWILAGQLNKSSLQPQSLRSFQVSVSNAEIHSQLNKFWQLDNLYGSSNNFTLEERICEEHFLETVTRTSGGRYIVQLPIKEELINNLGNSREVALKRLQGLERRFSRDANLKLQYCQFLQEYIALGHMRPIDESSSSQEKVYYMPHHCVLKKEAKSTKFRVVFDASCKTDTGISLNKSMMIGPVVQEDLSSILMRFRTFRYVLVVDIIKMYRQILVHPSQIRFQRILWRDDKAMNVQAYELITVTYGTAAASYLATRCLKDLAERYSHKFPIGSSCVKRDFYMDDLLTGADSKHELIKIRDQAIQLLRLGSFELSKWGSNSLDLLSDVDNLSEVLVPFDVDGGFRILGIQWDRENDTFQFLFNPPSFPDIITKRSILSEVSRLFDPLGLLAPVLVLAKILLQDIWRSGVDWDEFVTQDIHTKWSQLKSQLSHLERLQIPRWVKYSTDSALMQVYGYCDASQLAYGACVYIRSGTGQEDYNSHLLVSKSRVSPLKAISLPRLELSAARLLSRLIDKIRSSFDLANIPIFLWSDSTITLNWITSPSRKWSTFVANRVGEIQRLTDIKFWRHVSSSTNSADAISRGMFPDDLIASSLWWHGPEYLKLAETHWPNDQSFRQVRDLPELAKTCAFVVSFDNSVINDLLDRFSNLNKICRILAYCLRFLSVHGTKPSTITVSPKEISDSLNVLCKTVQRQCFSNEYEALSKHSKIKTSSSIASLNPFLSENDLIRVGGRIERSTLPFDACHQILLPRRHLLTKRLIEFEHLRNLHCGLQATMAAVRQQFWPLALRSTTRNIISKCITCFKAKPVFSEAIMGSLPSPRVTVSRPFTHCGIDYAGPVILRDSKRRNSRNHKAYIAVFICFATKVVHLELVSDLTTDASQEAYIPERKT